jgi:predicted transcriptional regulator
MALFFRKQAESIPEDTSTAMPTEQASSAEETLADKETPIIEYIGYLSDLEEDELEADDGEEEGDSELWVDEDSNEPDERPKKRRRVLKVPELPDRDGRRVKREARQKLLEQALKDIRWAIKSKRLEFQNGNNGLQAYRAYAVQSHLAMIVENGRTATAASQIAAEAHGFSPKWGARLVRSWARDWIKTRDLPESEKGRHVKVFSLLQNTDVRMELQAYVRSNKWSMNPKKLAEFSEQKMVPTEAKKYLEGVVEQEMPRGLQKYIQTELFPRIGVKASKGISLSTARRWLRNEGFHYIHHKKALYYDGHERPDVVDYRQNDFLPKMAEYLPRLVDFEVDDVEQPKAPANYVERGIVAVWHDEMTAQGNDGQKMGWVYEGEQPLKKKGQGRGLHQSDVICSTCGWLEEASETLEYGKNYDGYWTGELLVKQVREHRKLYRWAMRLIDTQLKEKIIPAFERIHGPGYQALIIVDNSQGHSAYAADALRTKSMNLSPGGKQGKMRDGWFIKNGRRHVQPMVFPANHDTHPNLAKGMREVLVERGLWRTGLLKECSKPNKCPVGATDCCATRILDLQPDFMETRSLVQEVIEAAGHLCIFLPKFHCELNCIEYFWGAVKQYLRSRCDYTFDTLKANLPLALKSVDVTLMRKWQHRVKRWMEAYRSGLNAKDAQIQVKSFSSYKYKSHRRIPESLAKLFD